MKTEDEDQAEAYKRQAETWFKAGDFREDERYGLFLQALKDYEDLADKYNDRLILRGTKSRIEQRLSK